MVKKIMKFQKSSVILFANLILGLTPATTDAQNKRVPCPTIIATKSTKKYVTNKGLICYNGVAAAKKAGYSAGPSCPQTVKPTPTPTSSDPVDVTSLTLLDSIEMSEIQYFGDPRYPEAGKTFRAYQIEVRSDFTLLCSEYTASWFNLILADGSEVKAFGRPNHEFPGARLGWSSEEIPAKQSRRGWIVFEVPIGSIPSQISFRVRATGFVDSDKFRYVSIQ